MSFKVCWPRYLVFLLMLHGVWECKAQNPDINVGDLFMLQLTKSYFFAPSDALPEDAVRFTASRLGQPDTPKWLHFLQRDSSQDAFLYGAPNAISDAMSLEVVAVNQRSFQTAYKMYNITVKPSGFDDQDHLHVVELWIKNFNVEELLKGKNIMTITRRLKRMWTDVEPRVVNVVSMSEVTGRTPVPASPGQEVKDGVIVQIGSPVEFSKQLNGVMVQIQDGRCDSPDDATVDIDKRFSPEFEVAWCHFKLINAEMQDEDEMEKIPMVAEPSPWIPRSTGITRQDFMCEFILIVILPLALALLIFIILSCVMFGKREGRKKRDRFQREAEMDQFHAVRGAMVNLRYMSKNRDGPPQLTPFPTPGPSAANTLTRYPGDLGQGPPPYKLPPSYTPQSADTPIDQSAGNIPDAGPTEEHNLMPQSLPETLKVR